MRDVIQCGTGILAALAVWLTIVPRAAAEPAASPRWEYADTIAGHKIEKRVELGANAQPRKIDLRIQGGSQEDELKLVVRCGPADMPQWSTVVRRRIPASTTVSAGPLLVEGGECSSVSISGRSVEPVWDNVTVIDLVHVDSKLVWKDDDSIREIHLRLQSFTTGDRKIAFRLVCGNWTRSVERTVPGGSTIDDANDLLVFVPTSRCSSVSVRDGKVLK